MSRRQDLEWYTATSVDELWLGDWAAEGIAALERPSPPGGVRGFLSGRAYIRSMATAPPSADAVLVRRLQERDRTAWEELYAEFQPAPPRLRLPADGQPARRGRPGAGDVRPRPARARPARPRDVELSRTCSRRRATSSSSRSSAGSGRSPSRRCRSPLCRRRSRTIPSAARSCGASRRRFASRTRGSRLASGSCSRSASSKTALRRDRRGRRAEGERRRAADFPRAREPTHGAAPREVDPARLPEVCRDFLPLLSRHLDGQLAGPSSSRRSRTSRGASAARRRSRCAKRSGATARFLPRSATGRGGPRGDRGRARPRATGAHAAPAACACRREDRRARGRGRRGALRRRRPRGRGARDRGKAGGGTGGTDRRAVCGHRHGDRATPRHPRDDEGLGGQADGEGDARADDDHDTGLSGDDRARAERRPALDRARPNDGARARDRAGAGDRYGSVRTPPPATRDRTAPTVSITGGPPRRPPSRPRPSRSRPARRAPRSRAASTTAPGRRARAPRHGRAPARSARARRPRHGPRGEHGRRRDAHLDDRAAARHDGADRDVHADAARELHRALGDVRVLGERARRDLRLLLRRGAVRAVPEPPHDPGRRRGRALACRSGRRTPPGTRGRPRRPRGRSSRRSPISSRR